MRAENYKITQFTVNNILGFVESSQIAIPEIQRPFVWKDKEVRDLIDSLYEGYPIGYLIIWQNSQIRVRGFGKGGTKKILIDGQQRVTALMASLLGKEVLDDQYQSRRIKIAFYPLAGTGEDTFAVCGPDQEKDPKWIPDISIFFRRDFSYRKFEKKYLADNPGINTKELEEAVDKLRGIIKHQVGIIELSFMLDIDVVSEIFIRINLQGKPLNQEDFVMSKISVNEQYDGDLIRNSIDYFCHLLKEPSFMNILNQNEKEFMSSSYGQALAWTAKDQETIYVPSYSDVLKVVLMAYFGKSKVGDLVNLLSGKEASKGSVSKKLTEESFKTLGKGVKAFISEENFKGFTKALKKAGYCCERLIYSQSLLNYCYAMYLIMGEEGISAEEKASLIGKWMAMSLVTGHYQSTPDSVVIRDRENALKEGFASYLSQIEELKMKDDFYEAILPEKYKSTSARTAPFLAYIASLCAGQTTSLYDENSLISDLYENKTEGYQILPKAYLEKCGFKTRETYGQVANITYISKNVKNVVKRQSPSKYKEALPKICDEQTIHNTLVANAVPSYLFEVDDSRVEDFFKDRRKMMAQKVKEYYQGL